MTLFEVNNFVTPAPNEETCKKDKKGKTGHLKFLHLHNIEKADSSLKFVSSVSFAPPFNFTSTAQGLVTSSPRKVIIQFPVDGFTCSLASQGCGRLADSVPALSLPFACSC